MARLVEIAASLVICGASVIIAGELINFPNSRTFKPEIGPGPNPIRGHPYFKHRNIHDLKFDKGPPARSQRWLRKQQQQSHQGK